MAGGTVSSGVSTYSSTFLTAGTAEATTFTDRYGYVVVENTSTSGEIYATADGSTPTGSGAGSGVAIGPGQSVVLANGMPLWYQSATVINQGTVQYPTGGGVTTTTRDGQPGEVQPFMSSQQGKSYTNPGTKVSLWTAATGGATSYTISGAG